MTMRPGAGHYKSEIVEYDSIRRRLWILGRRCHHGATGSLVGSIWFQPGRGNQPWAR